MRTHALRLHPGVDLRIALEQAVLTQRLAAACVVTCVGSLANAKLRLAGGDEVLELEGPLEIVSLVGTLSPDGPHLHVALADGTGRVHGGHLLAGSTIFTTAEIVLAELEGCRFTREPDPATGWRELRVQREA